VARRVSESRVSHSLDPVKTTNNNLLPSKSRANLSNVEKQKEEEESMRFDSLTVRLRRRG